MLTTRTLTGDGFGNKERAWNKKDQLLHWKEEWARHVNRALERGGHDARVDHRSLKAQGIDREPQPKLGPVATQMEREGRDSHAGDDVREVQARNAARDELRREAQIIDLELTRQRRQGRAIETGQGAAVIAGLDAIDRHDQRQIERQSADATVRQAETHCRRLERREAFAAKKDAALERRFEAVFRDGGKAWGRFQGMADREGWRRALWTLRTRTKDIGTLKGWGFLAFRSGARRQAEREFWKLVKEAGRTEGLKAKVAAEAPDRDAARAWVDEAKRRQAEEFARPDPARQDLQIALAETARGLSNADYSALTADERFMLKDARETAKAHKPAQLHRETEAERAAKEQRRRAETARRTAAARAEQQQQREIAPPVPQKPPERQDAPARQNTPAPPERPSEALQRAAEPPPRDEAFERRLAEIRAQRAEERRRNRERGRDMGRTR